MPDLKAETCFTSKAFLSCTLTCSFLCVLGVPSIMPPSPPQDRAKIGDGRFNGNPLRDYMLKNPDSDSGPSREPRNDSAPSYGSPEFPSSPFNRWTPFSKVKEKLGSISISLLRFCGNVKFLLFFLITSLMIFGDGGHRKLQRRSAKKT